MTVTASPPRVRGSSARRPPSAPAPARPRGQTGRHVMLAGISLLWLVPLLWAVFTSLRPYEDTAAHGYLSWPRSIGLDNFTAAWGQSGMPHYFWNSVLVTVPAVLGTLFFSAAVAFFVSRFDFRWNIALLMLFTAGNLLPAQVLITPLYRLYLQVPLPAWMSDSLLLYNSYWGIIAIHIAYQCGFCTFVLSNYMKTIPKEITEAALVDGAQVWRQFLQIVLPLCRPAFAALATLESIWIYNDFFWPLVLIETGDKRPVTSALASLQGQYFTNPNLIAAGALMTAVPTLLVYFALQRQFISGLTIGAGK
ncbi:MULTISPECIES: carbohydrate ABC transporter permease [unclassified Streptomyces]|uniref:carbohydrate ABC transporter permease n=1 Tax=unclassified Streptomyces TaxID=2593676 RepID=UPI002DD7D1E7|nr:carbohydrate ABC transporter permease [Streptomyces sp. NBC_01257]WRZ69297.1 carbohydrate ABC transporter permease [Streptomyces sp. NBC_01257]WSU63233.1 carbohydrate ABC transporter permease [Streptomyces sp. NBC_01104]